MVRQRENMLFLSILAFIYIHSMQGVKELMNMTICELCFNDSQPLVVMQPSLTLIGIAIKGMKYE